MEEERVVAEELLDLLRDADRALAGLHLAENPARPRIVDMVAALFMDAVGVVDPRAATEDDDVAFVVPVFGRVEVVVCHDVERLALADLLHRLVRSGLEASARDNPALLVGDSGGRFRARGLRLRLSLPLRGLRAGHRP